MGDLGGVSVIMPARDEAELIGRTIAALGRQGRGLDVVVVDDQSSDDTRGAAARAAAAGSRAARPRGPAAAAKAGPASCGRSSKDSAVVDRPYVLLLDADIELAPGLVPALLARRTSAMRRSSR